MIRAVLLAAFALTGCAVDAGPAVCRDPGSVVFMAERVESDCEDFVPPEIATCFQLRGAFDRDACLVSAEYYCTDGVRAVVLFSFCSGELASGFETYRRAGDGCRLERTMVEAVE